MVDSMMQLHENALNGNREDIIKWMHELNWRLRTHKMPYELYATLTLEADRLLKEKKDGDK